MKSATESISVAGQPKPERARELHHGRVFGGARFLEFHDQEWFPKSLRDYVTDALQFVLSLGGIYRPIFHRLNEAIQASGAERVVDLCSGGGGPWLWLYKLVCEKSRRSMEVCLTDKYPNIPAFQS